MDTLDRNTAAYWTKIRDDNERKYLQDLDDKFENFLRLLELKMNMPPCRVYNASCEDYCSSKKLQYSTHARPVGAPVVSNLTNLCRQLHEFVEYNSHYNSLRFALKPVRDSVWHPLPHKFATTASEFVPGASEHRLLL
jgi:hypothetical protein